MVRLPILALLACALVRSAPAEEATDSQTDKVHFRWAFAAVSGAGEDQQFLSVKRDTVLHSGDRFKMLIQLQDSCFVYLLHRGPDDAVQLLFPSELPQQTDDYLHVRRFLPADGWFTFDDHVGLERFYLVASVSPLTSLETLIGQYTAADSTAQAGLAGGIVEEIRRLRKEYTTLSSAAERAVAIAGNLRGDSDRIAESAVEITVATFYAKTITIDHR